MSYGTVGGVWTKEGGGIKAERLVTRHFEVTIHDYAARVRDLIAVGQDEAAFDILMVCPHINQDRKFELCRKFFPYLFYCD